eukprot:3087954-Pyramimonas_sp.AAC.1
MALARHMGSRGWQALQANIMDAQRMQPYHMANDEMNKWRSVWNCHDAQSIHVLHDHTSWPSLLFIYVHCARAAIVAFSWKTAAGPVRIRPRAYGYVSDFRLQTAAGFFDVKPAAASVAKRSDIS